MGNNESKDREGYNINSSINLPKKEYTTIDISDQNLRHIIFKTALMISDIRAINNIDSEITLAGICAEVLTTDIKNEFLKLQLTCDHG